MRNGITWSVLALCLTSLIHSFEDSLEWFCRKCSADKCFACEIILRRGKTITCSTCSNKYHIRCVGLNNQTIVSVDTSYWNCSNCKNDIFPFNTITPLQIETLSFNSLDATKHMKKFRTLNLLPSAKKIDHQYITSCSVCSKKVNNTSKSIPCPNCNHFIHKKCCKLTNSEIIDLKRSHNIWECLSCSASKFPLANVDEDEIHSFCKGLDSGILSTSHINTRQNEFMRHSRPHQAWNTF